MIGDQGQHGGTSNEHTDGGQYVQLRRRHQAKPARLARESNTLARNIRRYRSSGQSEVSIGKGSPRPEPLDFGRAARRKLNASSSNSRTIAFRAGMAGYLRRSLSSAAILCPARAGASPASEAASACAPTPVAPPAPEGAHTVAASLLTLLYPRANSDTLAIVCPALKERRAL